MQFEAPLLGGTLVQRYKRFLADVKLDNGELVTAHCANPGSMLGLKAEGVRVWLSPATNPKRKLKYNWELVEVDDGNGNTLVGIHTGHPNKIVLEAILDGTISELAGYETHRPEVKYGSQNSRIDLLLQAPGKSDCYVEVKNVHLCRTPALAEFPDAKTARGKKHLEELVLMKSEGARAVMIYLVQRTDCTQFTLASDIDPDYDAAFQTARQAGVEAYAYSCKISRKEITADRKIPML